MKKLFRIYRNVRTGRASYSLQLPRPFVINSPQPNPDQPMKTVRSLIIVLLSLLAWNSHAASVGPSGPVTIDLNAVGQALQNDLVSSKTNVVGTKTNYNSIFKSTTTNFTMNADSILELLTNSFRTNLPAGAQLRLGGNAGFYSFLVMDRAGSNVLLNAAQVGQVLSLTFQGRVHSGMLTDSTTNHVELTGNDTESFTAALSFKYDDTAMTTGDGLHTILYLDCFVQSRFSQNVGTDGVTENVNMNVFGAGYIRGGPGAVFTGTIRARISGVLNPS